MIHWVIEQCVAREVDDGLSEVEHTMKQSIVLSVSLQNFFENITFNERARRKLAFDDLIHVTENEFQHGLEIDHGHLQHVALVVSDVGAGVI